MKVIEGLEYYIPTKEEVSVFLAGGITNCEDWQKRVIDYLRSVDMDNDNELDNLVIFNPRINDIPIATEMGYDEFRRRKLNWDADYISSADIFSMYFANSNGVISDQAMSFYELGRYSHRSTDIISYQEGFSRALDVEVLMSISNNWSHVHKNVTPEEHAKLILEAYREEVNCYRRYADEEELAERYNTRYTSRYYPRRQRKR